MQPGQPLSQPAGTTCACRLPLAERANRRHRLAAPRCRSNSTASLAAGSALRSTKPAQVAARPSTSLPEAARSRRVHRTRRLCAQEAGLCLSRPINGWRRAHALSCGRNLSGGGSNANANATATRTAPASWRPESNRFAGRPARPACRLLSGAGGRVLRESWPGDIYAAPGGRAGSSWPAARPLFSWRALRVNHELAQVPYWQCKFGQRRRRPPCERPLIIGAGPIAIWPNARANGGRAAGAEALILSSNCIELGGQK